MGGQYLNKIDKYKMFLSNWIENSISSKSWENYQDLHLDEIDSVFKRKINWVKGAFFIYEIILDLIDSDFYNCLLVISLSYSDLPTDANQLTWVKINTLLDLTPPSLYFYPKNEKNYEETIKSLSYIQGLSDECGYKVFFRQEKEIEGEYNRSIYVISQQK